MVDNPYAGVGRPVTGVSFVGRETISKEIFDSLIGLGCVSLSGLGRIGKSSLAREVFSRIEASDPSFQTGYVNVNEFRTQSDLWREIIFEIFPDSSLLEDWPSDDSAAYLKLRGCFRSERRSREKNYILLLDEFDGVSDYNQASLVIDRIREMACDHNRYGLSFLFVSRRSLKRIQTECAGSNLFGICYNQTLLPFSRREVQLLCELSFSPSDEILDVLFRLTGGIPYLCATFLNKIILSGVDLSQIDKNIVDGIENAMWSDVYNYFNQLRDFLDEGSLWKTMCREFVHPKVEESPSADIVELNRYGLLTNQSQSGCLCDSLCVYINDSVHYTSMWEPLANFERALRTEVKRALKSLYGEDWISEAQKKKGYYSRLFPKLDELRIKEQSVFSVGSKEDLLEYSYPGTLKDIVMTEWDTVFASMFEGFSKAEFCRHMDAICLLRNPTNHYRRAELVPTNVKLRAQESIEALSSSLFTTSD